MQTEDIFLTFSDPEAEVHYKDPINTIQYRH